MRQAIHAVTVHHRTGVTRDGEGHTTRQETHVTVMGHVGMVGASEQATAGTRGVTLDAVAAVPRDTAVADPDRVTVAGAGPVLDGDYEVDSVRDAVKHLRVMLKRLTA